MDIVINRREKLRQWFDGKVVPAKEKSYISQLMSGKAAFGEKAARRLEKTYGMGIGYLDSSPDAVPDPFVGGHPAIVEVVALMERCDDRTKTVILETVRQLASSLKSDAQRKRATSG